MWDSDVNHGVGPPKAMMSFIRPSALLTIHLNLLLLPLLFDSRIPCNPTKLRTAMLFGRRRLRPPPVKRTASMTLLGLDLTITNHVGGNTPDAPSPFFVQEGLDQRTPAETIPTRNSRRHSADFLVMEAASPGQYFLGTCCLCKRQLIPGRDIFMYRGDSAFCSHECRQQQMKQDERKEKCSLSASTKQHPTSVTTDGETVAAI